MFERKLLIERIDKFIEQNLSMQNIFENLILNLSSKATERAEIKYVVNNILSGRQPRQNVKVFRRFGN
jgi:hypothetical protein